MNFSRYLSRPCAPSAFRMVKHLTFMLNVFDSFKQCVTFSFLKKFPDSSTM